MDFFTDLIFHRCIHPPITFPPHYVVIFDRECGWRTLETTVPCVDPCSVCLERKCMVAVEGTCFSNMTNFCKREEIKFSHINKLCAFVMQVVTMSSAHNVLCIFVQQTRLLQLIKDHRVQLHVLFAGTALCHMSSFQRQDPYW